MREIIRQAWLYSTVILFLAGAKAYDVLDTRRTAERTAQMDAALRASAPAQTMDSIIDHANHGNVREFDQDLFHLPYSKMFQYSVEMEGQTLDAFVYITGLDTIQTDKLMIHESNGGKKTESMYIFLRDKKGVPFMLYQVNDEKHKWTHSDPDTTRGWTDPCQKIQEMLDAEPKRSDARLNIERA
ncbi:MAG: hypothetical protein KJ709_08265 [Nanoarchaeota archaeon]|nr:hypothetical protein [Nanoarchaeota archaeon]